MISSENFSEGSVAPSQGSGDVPVTAGQFNGLSNIVIGVLIASVGIVLTLLFQLGAIWIDHFDSKRASCELLNDKIEQQNRLLSNFTNNYEIQKRQSISESK